MNKHVNAQPRLFVATAIAAAFAAGGPLAGASVITNQADFNSMFTGLTLQDFEGIAPPGGFIADPDQTGLGATFSDANGSTSFIVISSANGLPGGPVAPSDYLAQGELDSSLLITFDAPVTVAGMNVAIFPPGGSLTSVTLEAFNGAALLDSITLNPLDSTAFTTFAGFFDLGDITSILLEPQEQGGAIFIDNLSFGSVVVPLPAPTSLFAVMGGALLLRRRRV